MSKGDASRSSEDRRKPAHAARWGPIIGTILLLVGIGLACGTILVRAHREYRAARAEYARMEDEVRRLRLETKRLMEEIQALKTDPEVIERIAREELHMVRPDEMVLSFPEASKR
ncbi:Cell division protein FtsL [bacterium HR08]|nr:Cell division protein FtsL [bacterium HR08]